MMTLMLEPVSRKTVKKRLVSGWYSGSKRWWWWCSWVWQRHVSRPIVQRLKSLQNFTHNCQSFATNWKYISFLKEEKTTRTWTFPLVENSEQNMEILVVYMFCGWMWRQKSGISPYLNLGLPLRGCKRLARIKKPRGGINLIFAGFGVGCQVRCLLGCYLTQPQIAALPQQPRLSIGWI